MCNNPGPPLLKITYNRSIKKDNSHTQSNGVKVNVIYCRHPRQSKEATQRGRLQECCRRLTVVNRVWPSPTMRHIFRSWEPVAGVRRDKGPFLLLREKGTLLRFFDTGRRFSDRHSLPSTTDDSMGLAHEA